MPHWSSGSNLVRHSRGTLSPFYAKQRRGRIRLTAPNSEQLAEAASLSNNYRSNIAKLGQLGVPRRLFSTPTRYAYSITAEATITSVAQLTKEATAVVTRGNFEMHSW